MGCLRNTQNQRILTSRYSSHWGHWGSKVGRNTQNQGGCDVDDDSEYTLPNANKNVSSNIEIHEREEAHIHGYILSVFQN